MRVKLFKIARYFSRVGPQTFYLFNFVVALFDHDFSPMSLYVSPIALLYKIKIA